MRYRFRRRPIPNAYALMYALSISALLSLLLGLGLRNLVRQYAQTAASDHVQQAIAAVISEKMSGYGYDYFVTLEKDAGGGVTAVTTDTAHINALSAELIYELAKASSDGRLDMRIPAGSLFRSALLSGRGPLIPIRVVLLTTSAVNFNGEFQSAGINQTKHRIMLNVSVGVNLLIPWGSVSQTVGAELLVAETVIVGRVPESYINLY